ncbi:MAG TPA: acyl-CoA dehydrogenase family protein, partial [Mycobacterium sp.]|nr:acyl-CoA dehydrogenase family protein [Mycobacterium sp.]
LQIHGSIGVTDEMPFLGFIRDSFNMALADGPTEVHLTNLARAILRGYEPDEDVFPDYHTPRRLERARIKYADVLRRHGLQPAAHTASV